MSLKEYLGDVNVFRTMLFKLFYQNSSKKQVNTIPWESEYEAAYHDGQLFFKSTFFIIAMGRFSLLLHNMMVSFLLHVSVAFAFQEIKL